MTSMVMVVGVTPMSDDVRVTPLQPAPDAAAVVGVVAADDEDDAALLAADDALDELELEPLREHADATRHTASAPYNHTDFLTGPPVIAAPHQAAT
jgi:hypothetical protein